MYIFSGIKRVRYFDGQLLSAADFRDEQEYVRQTRFLHNRALHGPGVVSGLSVGLSSDTPQEIVVEPGLALDPRGREVMLVEEVRLALCDDRSPHYLVIEYAERDAEAARIEEGALVRWSNDAEAGDGVVIGRVVPDATGWLVDATFEAPTAFPYGKMRVSRPEVIVDFDVREGLLFVSLENIGAGCACDVTTSFAPAFSGLGGKKDIAGMNVFRRVEFMPPGKAFVQLVDPFAVYVGRQEPMTLSATIAYRDRWAHQYTDVVSHDLRVYLDLGDVVGRGPASQARPQP